MPSAASSELKFDIGHVLFIDIVGYSKLNIHEQSELLDTLKRVVRGTEQFRLAEAEGKLLRLPTGDGGALVFRTTPEAPVLCALEISLALRSYPQLHVRMGIHSGPVNEISDLNEQANIAGAGINIAQRVMDCGDAGHILLSKHVADDLEHYPRWKPYLHALGECEVKHGMRIGIANLYRDGIGNPNPPNKFRVLRQRRARARWIAIAAAILFLCGIIAAFVILSHRSAISNLPGKSIAVLPFRNMSADKNDEYLSDGMTEELLNVLAKVKGLRVPGRSSSFAFKGKDDENIFRKVGEQLHVNTVLEGSVRKAGDKLRITAQLINVADGYHLWSDTYDRDMKDILAVESEVAQRVLQALQVQLGLEETRALTKNATENPEAHRLYLLGRYHQAKFTEADIAEAARCFEQALQLDPNYALAYCGWADNYSEDNSLPGRESLPKQRALAQKALELDPQLAEAHLALGTALANAFPFEPGHHDSIFSTAAWTELSRALELKPNLPGAYDTAAWILACSGRFDEAIANEKKAIELDPLNPFWNFELGRFLYYARRYDAAITQFRAVIDLFPGDAYSHDGMGFCFLRTGKLAEARVELRKAIQLDDLPGYTGDLGYIYAVSGDRAKAEQIIHDLENLAQKRYVSPGVCAPIYLALGDKEKALDGLEKAYEDQDFGLWWLKVDTIFDGLRNEPRFQALLNKMGLD